MDTGSKDEGDHNGIDQASAEPLGLSAIADGNPPGLRPRTPIAPEHQQAVELIARARRNLREAGSREAKQLFLQAAELELQVLRTVASQPERSLIAELGARAALHAGNYDLARKLVRGGLRPRASEMAQWALLLASMQADLLEFLEDFEDSWSIPWDAADEEESVILLVSRSERRLFFTLDPEASSVSEAGANPTELRLVIPAERPSSATLGTLEALLSRWLRPRRRAQPIAERRGLVEHFLLELVYP